MAELKSEITWREAFPADPSQLPDADLEALVYDGYLDDVVKGWLDVDQDGKQVWIEQVTGDPLKDPQWWAEVPFPGEEK